MIVLDTNVVSHIFNGDNTGRYFRRHIEGQRAIISFQTLEELWYGAYWKKWGARRRNELARHLDDYAVIWQVPNS